MWDAGHRSHEGEAPKAIWEETRHPLKTGGEKILAVEIPKKKMEETSHERSRRWGGGSWGRQKKLGLQTVKISAKKKQKR